MAPTLETERLRLRPWREDDLDAYAAYCADEPIARFTGGVCGREDAWRRIALYLGHWQLKGYGNWVIEERASGAFAGYTGLWSPEGWAHRELMWGLARAFHGRGYATEAARRARDFALCGLGWPALYSYILPENEPSRRVAGRLGAFPDGQIPLRGAMLDLWRHPPVA